MSQHDYVIDNQSAPAARADINAVLQAIATTNSGGASPVTTYANQIWYDTAANQLKKRNEANSAWIVLGTVDDTGGTFTPNSLLTTAGVAPATLVTSTETIGSNNNNTTIPTSAAVKAYADLAADGVSPTTGRVLAATAGASGSGIVGTYAFLRNADPSGRNCFPGGTYAGGLFYAGVDGSSSAVVGTWRCMGIAEHTNKTTFLRVS
jgi:hypothetical protein